MSTPRHPIVQEWLEEMNLFRGFGSATALYHLSMDADYLRETFNFDAPYQRGLVWSLAQKQKLIESLLSGIMMPAVYLREFEIVDTIKPQYEVIDGKQRLTTLIDFFADRFPYRGILFSEWDQVSRRTFLNATYSRVVVKNIPDELAAEIYERLNFCGVPHKKDS